MHHPKRSYRDKPRSAARTRHVEGAERSQRGTHEAKGKVRPAPTRSPHVTNSRGEGPERWIGGGSYAKDLFAIGVIGVRLMAIPSFAGVSAYAAVIDQEDGKPHIVKRVDHPVIRVIPEWFGSGVLPRSELHKAAQELGPGQSALIVVGEPTLDKAFDRAVVRAARTVKHDLDAAIDELEKELLKAGKE
jgi:hypothetical protein